MACTRSLIAAGLALASAAVAMASTWWRADRGALRLNRELTDPAGELSGIDVVGAWPLVALGVLTAATLVLSARSGKPAGALGAAAATAGGFIAIVVAVRALADWATGLPGPWVTLAAGLVATVAAVASVAAWTGRAGSALLVAALAGTLVPAIGAGEGLPDRADVGPFRWIADLRNIDELPGFDGAVALPWGDGVGDVAGVPVVITGSALVGVGSDGRSAVVARASGDVLGVSGHRAVLTGGSDSVRVVSTRPNSGQGFTIDGLDVHGRFRIAAIGPDGATALFDAGGTLRRLDLATLPVTGQVAAAELPVAAAVGTDFGRVYPYSIAVVPGGFVQEELGSGRDEPGARLQMIGVDGVVRTLAGGRDAGCGYTNDPARTYLSSTYDNNGMLGLPHVAVDGAGGIWFADRRTGGVHRLLRLGPDRVLRIVETPLPGPPLDLHVASDGALLVAVGGSVSGSGALWRLPDAVAATSALPAPAADCGTTRRPAGPPVALGPELAQALTSAQVADGHGGTWEIEPTVTGQDRVLRHRTSTGTGTVDRIPVPGGRRSVAITGADLTGRPPLLTMSDGVMRLVDGRLVRVANDSALISTRTWSVIGADGHGWLLVDGRLRPVDPDDRIGAAVIHPGPSGPDESYVDVQLAEGVPPQALSIGKAVLDVPRLGIDAAGRAVVVTCGVVLRADRSGTVEVLGELPAHLTEDFFRQARSGPVQLVLPG